MTERAELFIDSRSELGEGPFWHPLLGRLFWFDILNQTLFSADDSGRIVDRLTFDTPVSAAAVIDEDTMAIASAQGLLRYERSTDSHTVMSPIEPDRPGNRTNDCRVDRAGGFWVSTMSRRGEADPGAGSIYQWRNGALEKLRSGITVPNSICFSPDGTLAYFADTPTGKIFKAPLDPESGRPLGEWTLFADTSDVPGFPDGAVVDAEGCLWSARWGGHCVARFRPDGRLDRTVEVASANVSCPAFGGPDLRTLFLTTARENLKPADLAADPEAGGIYRIEVDVPGLPEPLLIP